jgi:large subunit ribosomal protein L9
MKVILTQDIKGTGKKDQVIEVSDGYARNFLFPRKLAVEASKQNVNARRNAEAAAAHKKDLEKEEAQQLAGRLSRLTVRLGVKAGENGRLFGSVTTQEVADALRAQHGIEIDKRKISLENEIKAFGTYEAEIKLGHSVTTSVFVMVGEENN